MVLCHALPAIIIATLPNVGNPLSRFHRVSADTNGSHHGISPGGVSGLIPEIPLASEDWTNHWKAHERGHKGYGSGISLKNKTQNANRA